MTDESDSIMLSKEQRKILEYLLEKYERSATFRGENSRNQSFSVKPEALFPKYADEREYDFFVELNRDLCDLRDRGLIEIKTINQRVTKVTVKPDQTFWTDELYRLLGRQPKRDILKGLSGFLSEEKAFIETRFPFGDLSEALLRYIEAQEERIAKGKLPEYYEEGRSDSRNSNHKPSVVGDMDYRDLWKVFRELQTVTEETYIRNLSIRLFHDSKRLETLAGKVESCLFRYGDYPEKDKVLEECNVIRTPSYVMIKGPVVLSLGAQTLDIGSLTGDIAFSTNSLRSITGIRLMGKTVITVENLTTFHSNDFGEEVALLYLGGYHNATKRVFLKKMHEANPGAEYFHFGDIDAGGFYIYEHLRRKTGIPFKTYRMNVATLEQYEQDTKPLTANDRDRIQSLIRKYETGELQNPEKEDIKKTLVRMLETGRKLEQEAVF